MDCLDSRDGYRRLCEFFGTTHQGNLAKKLGCHPSRVSQVCSGSRIPDAWLLHLLKEYGLNPEWVLHGDPHPKKLKPDV